jgi:hypothetical protein
MANAFSLWQTKKILGLTGAQGEHRGSRTHSQRRRVPLWRCFGTFGWKSSRAVILQHSTTEAKSINVDSIPASIFELPQA